MQSKWKLLNRVASQGFSIWQLFLQVNTYGSTINALLAG